MRTSSSVKPSPLRISVARASPDQASMSASRVCTSAMRLGSVAVSASASSEARSVSAASTVSRRVSSEPGTSWATPPMRAARGTSIRPESSVSWPRIRRKRVVLPVPLRPTRPTLWPVGMTAEACSMSGRPSTE